MFGREGAVHQKANRGVIERNQLDHAAARDEGGVHLEVGVLRGGAHQDDDAILDRMEQGILLGAVEAVDLVHEEYRAQAARHEAGLRRLDLATEVLDRPRDRRDLDELRVSGVGDDARERRLAGAGGALEQP